MAIMELKVETTKQSMEEIRPVLDAALAKQFPGGALKLEWNGDVLELTSVVEEDRQAVDPVEDDDHH